MVCSHNRSVVRWLSALLLVITVPWAMGIKMELNDNQIGSILWLGETKKNKKKHAQSLCDPKEAPFSSCKSAVWVYTNGLVSTLTYAVQNPNETKFRSNVIFCTL